ncbi:MAG: hypothetical protein L3K09_07615 [Thermoplasmata archaeon]|nr:hypothetical protein [Thermoplasmata archaeon]
MASIAGLLSVVVVMLIAPSGLAAHAGSVTIKAPYTGAASPTSSTTTTGCASAGNTPAWNFHLNTGRGIGASMAKDSECSALFGGANSYSYAYAYGGFEVGVAIKVPTNGPHHVAANLFTGWRATGGAFDGSRTGSCASASTGGSATYIYYFDGTNWSYTVPVGGPVLNNSTYFFYESSAYAYGSCSTESVAYVVASTWIQDTTNGSYIYPTSTFGSSTVLVDQFTETYNTTDWGCYNYTLWDFGLWANATYGCYNYNATTSTYSINYLTGVSGTSTSYSDSGAMTGTVWTNATLYHNHHYAWFLDLYTEAYVYVTGWKHGSGVAMVNMASHGNGVNLNWIKVS